MLSNTGNILVLGSVLFTSLIIYSTFENIKNKNFKISNKLIYFLSENTSLYFLNSSQLKTVSNSSSNGGR